MFVRASVCVSSCLSVCLSRPLVGIRTTFWLKLAAISPRATVQESLRFHANDKVGFAWKPGQNIQNSAIVNEASENVREEKEHESEDMRT